ncbi:MAG: deoxyribodipyrimidine photo-lyase, partial [Chloroflexota bacterium]
MSNKTVWWIRRDLRLFDNPALHQALESGSQTVPLFILDDTLLTHYAAAETRIAFLFDGLKRLDETLRQLGSYLVVRRGKPEAVLPAFVKEIEAAMVFAQEDTSPYAIKRDRELVEQLPLTLTGGTLIRPVELVTKKDGKPYTVFTPYKKMWLSHALPHQRDLLPIPNKIDTPAGIPTDSIPDSPTLP